MRPPPAPISRLWTPWETVWAQSGHQVNTCWGESILMGRQLPAPDVVAIPKSLHFKTSIYLLWSKVQMYCFNLSIWLFSVFPIKKSFYVSLNGLKFLWIYIQMWKFWIMGHTQLLSKFVGICIPISCDSRPSPTSFPKFECVTFFEFC